MTDNAKTHEISEIFMSLEGEGPYTSHPTVYIRFARCNMKCAGFNNPTQTVTPSGYAPLKFDPKLYTKLADIPLIDCGCDSQYSVNPDFAHMWDKLTVDQIVHKLIELIPHNKWVHPDTKLPVILSFTGGEPTLKWKVIQEILSHDLMYDCRHVLIETNCSVPINPSFQDFIHGWVYDHTRSRLVRKWTWSNSPKLSNSGELKSRAIVPSVAINQLALIADHIEQYFKFVAGPTNEQFDEIAETMAEYYSHGVLRQPNVYVMPEACSQAQQQEIDKQVAAMCMERGYILCYRFQNALWNNGVGC